QRALDDERRSADKEHLDETERLASLDHLVDETAGAVAELVELERKAGDLVDQLVAALGEQKRAFGDAIVLADRVETTTRATKMDAAVLRGVLAVRIAEARRRDGRQRSESNGSWLEPAPANMSSAERTTPRGAGIERARSVLNARDKK